MLNRVVVALDNILKFPWWVYLLVGVAGYAALMFWLPATGLTNLIGNAGASIAPFFLALMLVLSAAAYFTRAQLRKFAGDVDIGFIKRLSWDEFSGLVSEAFERKGFDVHESEAKKIDFILRKEGKKYIVNCKEWKSVKVTLPAVEDFFKVMAAVEADGGYMLTSGFFDDDATEFAAGKNIRLLDNAELRKFLAVLDSATTRGARQRYDARQHAEEITGRRDILCPKCGRSMFKRERHSDDGGVIRYYACSAYPACRGERPIA